MTDDINFIIHKYLDGNATEREREIVDAWYQSFESKPGWLEQLQPEEAVSETARSFAALAGKLDLH